MCHIGSTIDYGAEGSGFDSQPGLHFFGSSHPLLTDNGVQSIFL